MKGIIVKYGTFLIVPFVIVIIAITLCTLRVREKLPITLISVSGQKGIAYIPLNAPRLIVKGDSLVLETAQSGNIKCLITNTTIEANNIRAEVDISSMKEFRGNTLCSAYLVIREIPMLELVIQKVL